MTKEELEKEAVEYAQKLGAKDFIAKPKEIVAYFGYLASAEPREKQIQIDAEQIRALQKQNGELTDKVNDLEDKLANADYQLEGRDNEIRKLESQIEKMINEIDKTMVFSNMRECEICDIQDIFRKYDFKHNNDNVWEMKDK